MRELRDAVRQWTRTPVITIVVVLSLALGIGANTAIFSLIDALLLRPLPVQHADRLVRVHNPRFNNHSIPTYEQIRDGPPVFEAVAAMSLMRPDVSATPERRSAAGIAVSGTFFDVLGVRPGLGRLIGPDDDRRDASTPVAVLEHRYWQSAFGGRPDVLGQTIPLDGKPFTIIGVTEPAFFGPTVGRRYDVAVSLAGYLHLYPGSYRVDASSFSIVGRLRNGQSIAAAQAELRGRQPRIRAALGVPDTLGQMMQPWDVVSMRQGMATSMREYYAAPLRILMALVALVLLVACVNAANLLLAKAAARRGELAVRMSLGASRLQVVGSVLLESLMVALAGAAGGLVVGAWTARSIVEAIAINQSGALTTWVHVPFDWRMLAFTSGVGVAAALAFGVGPAWRATRVHPLDALRARARGSVDGGVRFGVAQLLVIAQIAVAFVLVAGGGLLVRSFVAMTTEHPGFNAARMTVAVPDFSRSQILRRDRVPVAERIRAELKRLPGIEGVALAESSPFGLGDGIAPLVVPGSDVDEMIVFNRVSDGYFSLLGIPLRAGRDFEPTARETPAAAIVNEAFAARYLPGRDPVGQAVRLRMQGREQLEIVGVVGNARSRSLREPVDPVVYVPFRANDEPWIEIDIRSGLGTAATQAAVLRTFARVAPSAGVEFRSIDAGMHFAAARDRTVAWLAGGYALLALLLSAIGLFGVTWHHVIRRRQEFGVRMAVGAAPSSVAFLVLKQTLVMVAIGLAVGLVGASASARLIEGLLYSVTPSDPVSIASAVFFLAVVTMVAALIPARRAAGVDPMTALREE